LGVRRQSEAAPASSGKPRYQIRGHPDFDKYLKQLRQSNRSEDKRLVELIDSAMVTLEERPTAGESVPRDRWPRAYADLELPNLYRYRLDRIHRMLYSIVKVGSSPIFVLIIETMDHTKYNQIFGYD
jgi:mRNA-degrading endonuclease RelE of RelBE toxin-antitoxin system